MDPSHNQSFRVGPFAAELAKQNAVQNEALAGGSLGGYCPTVTQPVCPIIPRARIDRTILQRDPIVSEYVVLELPVENAQMLRALLGSLGVETNKMNGTRFLRTIGKFPRQPGVQGIYAALKENDTFNFSDVASAAAMVVKALRQAGV